MNLTSEVHNVSKKKKKKRKIGTTIENCIGTFFSSQRNVE